MMVKPEAETARRSSPSGVIVEGMIERRRSKISGWGVYATQVIPKNKRIIDYAGEKITHKESLEREHKYLQKGQIWCFTLNNRWVIDAGVGGNIARFINHACKPNCYSHIVEGTIWIRASRTIRKGEELSYDYNTTGDAEILCKCQPDCTHKL
jgi:SET domain-containing protein